MLSLAEEAFTSENWIVRPSLSLSSTLPADPPLPPRAQVRIYAVKPEDNLGRDHRSANAFDAGKRRKKVTSLPTSVASGKGKAGARK